VILMLGLLGLNPRLEEYLQLPMHWIKLALTVTLAGAALAIVIRLSKPGVPLAWTPILLLVPPLAIASLAVVVLLATPSAQRPELFFGSTWASCPLLITLLSLPAFVLVVWAMRGLAPTRLRLAGGAAGLLAGTAGATAYTLHCPELAAPFLAVWYLLGMLLPATFGTLFGPRLLRW